MRPPFDPPGYRYPVRTDPVPIETFRAELAEMLLRGGLDPRQAKLRWPQELDFEHWEHPRRYAQVHVPTMTFEFAHAVLWLHDSHRIGLLAHEVGHVLTDGTTEEAADRAAERVLYVPIVYDLRWPGKGLQCAAGGLR